MYVEIIEWEKNPHCITIHLSSFLSYVKSNRTKEGKVVYATSSQVCKFCGQSDPTMR